ncbi:MAG TPA: hypothetical protein VFH51_01155, partial [Myxococcota bacterium]|nr:hypothetical protein [Myxococcota bacterium]
IRQRTRPRAFDGRVVSVCDAPRVVYDLAGAALSAMALTRLRAPAYAVPGETVAVEATVHNVGNTPTRPDSLSLAVVHAGERRVLPLGAVPVLAPGEGATLRGVWRVPQQEAGRVTVRLEVERRGGPLADGWPASVVVTQGEEPHLAVRSVSLHPMHPAEAVSARVRLENDGNVPLADLAAQVLFVDAVHEGVYDVPHEPLTERRRLPPLAVGERRTVEIALLRRPRARGEFTLRAVVYQRGVATTQGMRAFHVAAGGVYLPQYNQEAHMGSVLTALDLLRIEGVYVADVHDEGSPYRGSPDTIFDWGTALGVATGQLVWRWGSDWDRYPERSKTLVDGASACDGIDVAFGDTGAETWNTHYWVVDQGDDVGLENHSALNKLQALLLGGHGSTIPDGAIAAYRAGDKARAWWLMGHAAHLLGDLSTGAHTLNRN